MDSKNSSFKLTKSQRQTDSPVIPRGGGWETRPPPPVCWDQDF